MDQPLPIREAATVMILRDGDSGLETWMMHRQSTMAFAAGMWVFPGGSVDPADALEGPAVEATAAGFGITPGHAGRIVAAAIREIKEEADLDLDPCDLRPWARLLTPVHQPLRYDTYFFVARLPDGASAAHVSSEGVEADWIGIENAVAQWRDGLRPIMPPTIRSLLEVSRHATVAEVLDAAIARELGQIVPTLSQEPNGALMVDFGDGNPIALPKLRRA